MPRGHGRDDESDPVSDVATPPNPVADLLDTAADYIEEHGWTRGAYRRRGRVCLNEALFRSAARLDVYRGAYLVLWDRTGGPVLWNDAQRSRVPVLKLLRDTARELRKEVTV